MGARGLNPFVNRETFKPQQAAVRELFWKS